MNCDADERWKHRRKYFKTNKKKFYSILSQRISSDKKIAAYDYTGADPKVMPPILLCWPTTSEADGGGVAGDVKPSRRYSVPFCSPMTDGSRGAA